MVDLEAILQALAEQIKANIDRGTNVYPLGLSEPRLPAITIIPGSTNGVFFDPFGTDGPDGVGQVNVTLRLQVSASPETTLKAICDYLGLGLKAAGQRNQSSIFDAVHSDRSLGGLVEDCVVLTADWQEPGTVELPVQILVGKQEANV